jgi:hypothetical protein
LNATPVTANDNELDNVMLNLERASASGSHWHCASTRACSLPPALAHQRYKRSHIQHEVPLQGLLARECKQHVRAANCPKDTLCARENCSDNDGEATGASRSEAARQLRRQVSRLNRSPPMTRSNPFFATCPVCGQSQVQRAYTRRALVSLLEHGRIIDAYCANCDVVWPVSAQERNLMTTAIAAGQPSASLESVANNSLHPAATE